jgi:hypothetical protein
VKLGLFTNDKGGFTRWTKITYADNEELMQFLDYKRIEHDSWWISWKYLPTGVKTITDDVPEFHNMNESAISLADDDILIDTVRQSVEIIEKEFLTKIK